VSLDKRQYPRYQLVAPLVGVVEQNGGRYSGSVLNISLGGFYLHLPRLPADSLKIHGVDDYGEFHYAGRTVSGFGSIVRIEKFVGSVGLGFCWDKEGMDAKSEQLLRDSISEQEARRAFAEVSVSGNTIVLRGHASSALSSDVFAMLRNIATGHAKLSLAECVSIDSSGIELLMALRDRGIAIIDVGPGIEPVLKRFQLLDARVNDDAR